MSADVDDLTRPAEASPARADDVALEAELRRAASNDLPGLVEAFESEAMAHHVAESLLGPAYEITSCALGPVIYTPGESCTLRYELEVRDRSTDTRLNRLVSARVFADGESCRRYWQRRLAPLLSRVDGRRDVRPFRRGAAAVERLGLALSVFPVDGELPTLVEATDPERMIAILSRALPDAAAGACTVVGCRVRRGHYGRRHRCVLRYDVDTRAAHTVQPGRASVYGKVASDDRGAVAGPVLRALRDSLDEQAPRARVNLPRSLGFHPELRLALFDAIPGAPLIGRLVKARVRGDDGRAPEGLTLEQSLDAAASAAARIHETAAGLGPRRLFSDELRALQAGSDRVGRLAPELAVRLRGVLSNVSARAATSDALGARLCHGDFSHTQLLFDGTRCGVVDFDTIGRAEPALDVGHFLAYLRLAVAKAAGGNGVVDRADDLASVFVDAYGSESGLPQARLRERATLYEALSLVRLAVHSAQKLKARRLRQVMRLLEQRSW
jgi:hypothetical protein